MTPALNGYNPDPNVMNEIHALGFRMIRVGVHTDPSEEHVLGFLQQFPFEDLIIVRDAAHVELLGGHLEDRHVEYWNEPDIAIDGIIPPHIYAAEAALFVAACHRVGATPWIGSISNTNQRGLTWLRQMFAALPVIEQPFGVTIHRYPNGQYWKTPHDGFGSIDDEIQAVKAIIGDRPWACSEFGEHTSPQRKYKWLPKWWPGNTWQRTDAQVAQDIALAWDDWRRLGAQFAVQYQITDGPDPSIDQNTFGIRRLDGVYKPVAYVLGG